MPGISLSSQDTLLPPGSITLGVLYLFKLCPLVQNTHLKCMNGFFIPSSLLKSRFAEFRNGWGFNDDLIFLFTRGETETYVVVDFLSKVTP